MKKISGIYIMPSSKNRRQRRQRQSQRRQRNQRQRGGNEDLKTLLINAEKKKVKDAEELITELQNLPADVVSDNTGSDVAKPFTFGETKTPKEGEGSADAGEGSADAGEGSADAGEGSADAGEGSADAGAGEGEEVNVITDAEVDKAEEKEEKEMPGGRRKSRRRKQRKNRKSQRKQRRR